MTTEKQAAIAAIEEKADLVAQVADQIWSFAELSLQEEQSADLYCRVLEQEGFTVERGISNIPTAFSASYGSGRPIIGLLAEYDALSGLSQKGGSLERQELVTPQAAMPVPRLEQQEVCLLPGASSPPPELACPRLEQQERGDPAVREHPR